MYSITGGNILLDINLILDKIHLKDNMKVADLGCGSSGHFVFPIANKLSKSGMIYAVDILKTVLSTIDRRIKQENIKNIKTIWSDLEIYGATKIESASIDLVCLINTLYQAKNRPAILREAIRIMKKDSHLLIIEWKNTSLPFGPPAQERVREDQLKNGCQKLGLKLEEEFSPGQYHYGMVFSKL